ncbi:MAG TPA: aldo/keto reductase [Clostridiales bacterium UBA8153]|nr:aldo/keto reductase [Clostridiales bacterium UBA8153]
MHKSVLGRTGLCVSELCLGALPMGPLQLGLAPADGARVTARALELGVNFVDTAQGYRTYAHLAPAIRGREVIVATKSAAADYPGMRGAVEEARRQLDREVIDIFHLHAAREGEEVFHKRAGALDCLLEARASGKVRAVGIATHSVAVVRAVAGRADLDVVFPIINTRGLGILHGTRDEMADAIAVAARAGKGVYAMKALGGGNLVSELENSLAYVRQLPGVTAVAVGMVSVDEAEELAAVFAGRPRPARLTGALQGKRLLVAGFCIGCGRCVDECPAGALSLQDGKCRVDPDRCILCAYCAPYCPEFAIRVV